MTELVRAVLHQRDAERVGQVRQHRGRDVEEHLLVTLRLGGPVRAERAFGLAKPDDRHLQQAAPDAEAVEIRVRLHAVHDDDGVGREERGADDHLDPERAVADLGHVHRRIDGRTNSTFGDAVSRQHFALALRCRAAVAPHGGHDHGLRPSRAEPCHESRRQLADAIHAAAADSEGHSPALPGLRRPRVIEGLPQRLSGVRERVMLNRRSHQALTWKRGHLSDLSCSTSTGSGEASVAISSTGRQSVNENFTTLFAACAET